MPDNGSLAIHLTVSRSTHSRSTKVTRIDRIIIIAVSEIIVTWEGRKMDFPTCILRPVEGAMLLEFCNGVWAPKTRMELPESERKNFDDMWNRFDTETERGRTVRNAISLSILCIKLIQNCWRWTITTFSCIFLHDLWLVAAATHKIFELQTQYFN